MYALIDSNNFFVSCERLFRPELNDLPVIVLSSNDGCAISRSNEAKALGITMGAPIFKLRHRLDIIPGNDTAKLRLLAGCGRPSRIERNLCVAFSANFELYGDISERITALLTGITPHIEVYSVDESFLDLDELPLGQTYAQWGQELHSHILHTIGIPASVGIAPTKTLAKLANHYAKHHPEADGSCLLDPLSSPRRWHTILAATGVEDVWGVGWRLAPQLKARGILTVLDLARMRPRHAGQLMGVHGRHMVYELNGVRCLPLQTVHKPQQTICRGRQFGADTSDLTVIESAVANLGTKAAKQLRHEKRLASRAAIILRTNRLKPNYQRLFIETRFFTPTNDTGVICSQLIAELSRRYNGHLLYHKADVMLYDLIPAEGGLQADIFGDVDIAASRRGQQRMQAFDGLNSRYGPGTVSYVSEHLSSAWQPRKNMASPRYTTSWPDLPVLHARDFLFRS